LSRILVTGATGFIGRPLVDGLVARGHDVRAVVRRGGLDIAGAETVVVSDFLDETCWPPLLAGIDTVIHLAALSHTGGKSEADYDRINRRLTETLIGAARSSNIARFIFISSVRAQSGPSADRRLTERDAAHPTDAYGRSKLAAEQALQRSGLPYTILRPVLVYGPRPKGNLRILLKLARSPLPLPFASATQPRSLLALENFISAIAHCLANPATRDEIFLVADRETVSLPRIIATWRGARGRGAGLFPLPLGAIEGLCRLVGRRDFYDKAFGALEVDTGKLSATGWRPAVRTDDGLAAMVSRD
jgi:UDP-glucose 4-epimerase